MATDPADLDAEQKRKLAAAVNAQRAYSAVTKQRAPALLRKRDEAVRDAVRAGVPAVVVARGMEGDLKEARISQIVSGGNGRG